MEATQLISVWVDFNTRKGGYVPAHQDEADGPLTVGSVVYAWDEFEPGLRAPAEVVAFDRQTGEALLDVDWTLLTDSDDTGVNPGSTRTLTFQGTVFVTGRRPQFRSSSEPSLHQPA